MMASVKGTGWLLVVLSVGCDGAPTASQDLAIGDAAVALDMAGGDAATAAPDLSGQPSSNIVWFSDWRTATGNSTAALRDNGKWTSELCAAPVAEVVPATGLAFPAGMANVFRSQYYMPGQCRMMHTDSQWPAPAVGQSLYFRIYYRNAVADGASLAEAHPIQATNIAWEWKLTTPAAGIAPLRWIFPQQVYPDIHFDAPLQTNQTYRVEWRIQHQAVGVCKVELRVYDGSDVLRFGNGDFLTELYLGQNIPLAVRNPDLACGASADFQTMEVGNNDPNVYTGVNQYVYWGGAAVSATHWVGPYTPSGG
jgi:hypothetical protein